jgi:hypothetical protein
MVLAALANQSDPSPFETRRAYDPALLRVRDLVLVARG